MENPFLVLKGDYRAALERIAGHLSQSGLQVVQTFDLQMARLQPGACTCPRHQMQPCDCQVAVLLVYGPGSPPASLLVHGFDGRTTFTLVDSARQSTAPQGLCARIRSALYGIEVLS